VPLARTLGVSADELSRWLEGHAAPPVNVYLMALDLVAGGPTGVRAKS
jgi:DNA-binding transcriptional regulator YiaG